MTWQASTSDVDNGTQESGNGNGERPRSENPPVAPAGT